MVSKIVDRRSTKNFIYGSFVIKVHIMVFKIVDKVELKKKNVFNPIICANHNFYDLSQIEVQPKL